MLHRMNGHAMVHAISQPVTRGDCDRATARTTASGAATTSRCAAIMVTSTLTGGC